jgi:hypothetical protein
VFAVVGVWASCASGSFVWALYGEPIALAADGSFGWTTPIEQTMQIFDFNPAQVLLNGRLDGPQAAGAFSATVDWDGDRCATGTVPWTASKG